MAEEEFFSLREVADRLKVSEQTVRRWVKSGQLKAYKPGLEYRIPASDLQEFLERRTPKASAPSPPEISEDERRIVTDEQLSDAKAQIAATERLILENLRQQWSLLRGPVRDFEDAGPEGRRSTFDATYALLDQVKRLRLNDEVVALGSTVLIAVQYMSAVYELGGHERGRGEADVADLQEFRQRMREVA